MTFKQMHDQVVTWLGLQDIASYSESDIVDDKLYQGTIDLLSRTRCTVRCVQLRTQANVSQYTLDQHILALLDVENGARRHLRRDQGCGVYGYNLIRSDLLVVVPTPSEDDMTMQVWAVMKPQPMAADGDSPSDETHGAIPEEFHDAIVGYALWKCADYADDATTQNGEYYRNLYEGADGRGGRLGQIRTLVNKRGGSRGPRARVRLSSISRSGSYT